jgi:L-erythro-3,5-diaminohexanoate dehydrogenase
MPIAIVPDDLPHEVSIAAFDVYPAASYARALARAGEHVLVLGAGHAGLVAIVAAREAVGGAGHVSTVDIAQDALARARAVDPSLTVLEVDATDPLAVSSALAAAGLPRADLTLLCTTVPGAEGTAILATAERGTVVFFSTATSFPAAALGVDAIGSRARLIIPNGQTADLGAYTLALLRANRTLLEAFEDAL